MSGADLHAACTALDGGQGLPNRLVWSPVSLAVLYRGRVKAWQLGAPPAAQPSPLASRCWPRAVFVAVTSALAEALLLDFAEGPDALGGGAGASA